MEEEGRRKGREEEIKGWRKGKMGREEQKGGKNKDHKDSR